MCRGGDGEDEGRWFDSGDHIEQLCSITTGQVCDREHVAYRVRVRKRRRRVPRRAAAYYATEDGKINCMRVLCSGYRPVTSGS